jgi:hypothetical protein
VFTKAKQAAHTNRKAHCTNHKVARSNHKADFINHLQFRDNPEAE